MTSKERLKFNCLNYLTSRELGKRKVNGWRNKFYSSLYTSYSKCLQTPAPPCDGQDWGSVFGFGFSPDGSLLAAACEKKCMLLYDPLNMRLISRKFNVHNDCVNCVKFLDNRLFATCSDDNTVKLWDMRSLKQEVRSLCGHTSWVKNIEYDSFTGKLLTSGFDGNVFTWDINNYSESQVPPEPALYINGVMRTVLTPAADKMIISTQGGYFIVIHNLDLEHLRADMHGFKPHLYRIMQVLKVPVNDAMEYNCMFSRDRNRIEYMGDFPPTDSAESISTIEVHPQGWCVASRNTTVDGDSEWTCVHDIQVMNDKRGKNSKGSKFCDSHKEESSDDGDSGDKLHHKRSKCQASSSHQNTQYLQSSSGDTREPSGPFLEEESHSSSSTMQLLEFLGSNQATSDSSTTDVSDNDDNLSTTSDQVVDISIDDSEEEDQVMPESSNIGHNLQSPTGSTTTSSSETSFAADSLHYFSQRQPLASRSTSRSSHSFNQDSDRWDPQILFLHNAISGGFQFNQGNVSSANLIPNVSLRIGERLTNATKYDNLKIRSMRPRLLFYLEEPNVGSGFIKEQSFSPDGRVLASPFGTCVRLLGFKDNCMELCDCVPHQSRSLKEVSMVGPMNSINSVVLASTFSPTHPLFAAGCRDGSIAFCTPKL